MKPNSGWAGTILRARLQIAVLLVLNLMGACTLRPSTATPPNTAGAAVPKELVAVLPFAAVGASPAEASAGTDRMQEELLATGRFTIVDRSQIDAVLNEQALQQTGCTGTDCTIKVGRILGVKQLVSGKVTKLDNTHWLISSSMIDAESAETLRAVSIDYEGAYFRLLSDGMPILAAKVAGLPPPSVAGFVGRVVDIVSNGIGQVLPDKTQLPPDTQALPPSTPAVRQIWRDSVTGMEFVLVPGGSFDMGCGSWAGHCFESEEPVHRVAVSSFWLGTTPVTQGQWNRIMSTNSSRFKNGNGYPVEQVSWEDAQRFIAGLNSQSKDAAFRLPTEAEWEYACRAGGKPQEYGTATGQLTIGLANWSEAGIGATTPVTRYQPNELGLYDMSGNVYQWVQDRFSKYDSSEYASLGAPNPLQERSGVNRVYRGGGWFNDAIHARCSGRYRVAPSFRLYDLGFRLARTERAPSN
jgi:formylglycine-generating enzyme required for sulfatase activity